MRIYSEFTLGVLATVAVFWQFFLTAMIVKSLGIVLVEMQSSLETDAWILGTAFALVECICDLLAPLAGPIGKALGYRPTVMIGGAMASAGIVAASRATSVLQVALCLNGPLALGYCLSNVLTRASLGQHFNEKDFALASGFTKCGASICLVCLPPLIQLCQASYGWSGALLIVGAMSANLSVCGALLIPSRYAPKKDYQPIDDDLDDGNSRRVTLWQMLNGFVKAGKYIFDLSILKDFNFWVVGLTVITARTTKTAWIIYFVPHVVAKGFSAESAATMVTVSGVGHLAGTLLVSVALYKRQVTSLDAMVISVVLVLLPCFADPWLTSSWAVTAGGVVFMAAVGSVYAIADVMVKEFLGYERMVGAYGWMGFFSVLRVLSGILPGWIYGHTGSYNIAFVTLGALQSTALGPLLLKKLHDRARE